MSSAAAQQSTPIGLNVLPNPTSAYHKDFWKDNRNYASSVFSKLKQNSKVYLSCAGRLVAFAAINAAHAALISTWTSSGKDLTVKLDCAMVVSCGVLLLDDVNKKMSAYLTPDSLDLCIADEMQQMIEGTELLKMEEEEAMAEEV